MIRRTAGGARGSRAAALAVALLVAAMLPVLAGPGSTAAFAQSPSPSPSSGDPTPSPAPTGPAIKLLNPSSGYEPGLDRTGEDPPKISDKYDGVDEAYQVVAVVAAPPSTALVEASLRYEGENEIVIGQLGRVGSSNVWELSWDVSQSLPTGLATLHVGLYEATPEGLVERAHDDVEVDMRHAGDDVDAVADDTAELMWPVQAGQIGFYKPRTGFWRSVVQTKVSISTDRAQAFYTTSPPGTTPKFTPCGTTTSSSFTLTPADPLSKSARLVCTLAGSDLPSAVTAIAMVAIGPDNNVGLPESQEAADVHHVTPYLQSPDRMTVTLPPWSRRLPNGCLAVTMLVNDELGAPVQGANVDLHATGPNDQLAFGPVVTGNGQAPPDKGGHENQSGTNCSGAAAGQQGLHRRPGESDTKHRESATGTTLGRFTFQFYSAAAGTTDLVAWIDDEEVETETKLRPADSDHLESGEPFAEGSLQWYPAAPVVSLDPPGATGSINECVPYLLKARSESTAVPEVNVDLHVQSAVDGVRFCVPEGGLPLRAPGGGSHSPIDTTHSLETAATTRTIHAETESDGAGNLLFGLTAPTPGDATITAWVDGEKGLDNDLLDAGDPRTTGTASWADCTNEAHASFLSPSAFGSGTPGPGTGTNVSTKLDGDRAYHVVVRSDCPDFAQTVQIQLASGDTFTTLGEATRIAGTDTFEFFWSPVPGDGSHRLRAHVVGAPADQEQTVTVNALDGSGGNPTERADETVELSQPVNGAPAGFGRGATDVRGIASSGAEGVDLFYTKASAKDTPSGADWVACGHVPLDGAGSAVQSFAGSCALKDPDQPSQVTAVAALAVDCGLGQDGCDASPNGTSRQLPTFKKDSGDAHRVLGYDSLPLVAISPAENEAPVGECTSFAIVAADDSGQSLSGENVDVHLRGPEEGATFCRLEGSSEWRAPAEGGHSFAPGREDQAAHEDEDGPDTFHIEGETDTEGRFEFGVRSNDTGDSELVAWMDRIEDDFAAADETTDGAVMHWISQSGCTVVGTQGADRLTGTAGPDRVCGLGGNDTIQGLGGDDVLIGGRGDDQVIGGRGDDVLIGGAGRDRLHGRVGSDRCSGGRGRDRMLSCGNGREVRRDRRDDRGGL